MFILATLIYYSEPPGILVWFIYICRYLSVYLKENDVKNRWNLIDYGDVVVHILHQEDREAYAIEKFWNHAFSVPKETWLEESKEYSEYKEIER